MRWGKPKDQPSGDEWTVSGAALPGTEATVDAIQPGVAAITALDPAFDPGAFISWSGTVYDRAVAAWRTQDPEPLRSVMDAAVWDDYAKHLLLLSRLPLLPSLMATARCTPSLLGTAADAGCQAAVVAFEVTPDLAAEGIDPIARVAFRVPGEAPRPWSELWLFQRPASARTHPSGAVAVCPNCGAPAPSEETARCHYCGADITTRTAGWLVTRTATTMTRFAKMDERLAQARDKITGEIGMPPPPIVAPPVQPPRAGSG